MEGGNQWQEPKAAKAQLCRREDNEGERGAREKVLSVWVGAIIICSIKSSLCSVAGNPSCMSVPPFAPHPNLHSSVYLNALRDLGVRVEIMERAC